MKLGDTQLDATDRRILGEIQEDCKTSLTKVGKRVGLSAPAVMERIRRLEDHGIIRGYHAQLDSRKVGLDVTAFIGMSTTPEGIVEMEPQLTEMAEVLECHHVTGAYTVLLKVRTQDTQALERLISRLRLLGGVLRTETLVVLSTQLERTQIPLDVTADVPAHGGRAGRPAQAGATKLSSVGSGPMARVSGERSER